VFRTLRYVMRPTTGQRLALDHVRVKCCELYNAALEQRILWWRKAKKSLSYNDQTKQLTELRKAEPSWASVSVEALRSALDRLDKAYKSFFRRIKNGETPGFPRFRSRDRYNSFGIARVVPKPGKAPGEAYIRVPNVGLVRFKMHRPMLGKVLRVELCKDAKGRWFVNLACDLGETPTKIAVKTLAGIDLGLTSFLVTSDNQTIENPRFFKRAQEKLARAQRILARKTRGSNARRRARLAVARVHEHVANQRKDFHHKLARALVEKFDFIAHEDLNIAGLARAILAKSVADVGWGQFISILTCKAEDAGKYVVAVDPQNTTKACSSCGTLVPKTLSERTHACACGCVLGRDHNAALNILARGLRAAHETLGLAPTAHL